VVQWTPTEKENMNTIIIIIAVGFAGLILTDLFDG